MGIRKVVAGGCVFLLLQFDVTSEILMNNWTQMKQNAVFDMNSAYRVQS